MNVAEANLMMCRCALLIIIASSVGCAWVLEQPSSSLAMLHPAMEWVVALSRVVPQIIKIYQVDTFLGQFKGKQMKPLRLTGNRLWLHCLNRSRPDPHSFGPNHTVTRHMAGNKLSVRGSPDLKATQAYTDNFGSAVCDAYIAFDQGVVVVR